MSEALRDQITRAMADVFDVQADEISANTSPETLEAWDSINHLSLVLALEQIFAVSFDLEEIPELTSVDAMVRAVERQAS